MISRIIVIAAILTGTSVGAKLEVDLAVESVVRNRLESGQVEAKKRQATIRDLFGEAGCSPGEQRVDKNSANVICTLPGQSTSSIVVGGHFDFAEHGTGMVDDWSGTALLPSLYQALKSRPHQHTYVFVAFAAEERGLVGSSRYVKNLTAERKDQINAFVNLECLGINPLKVWSTRSTPALVTHLMAIANTLDTTIQRVNVERIGDDDTHPFLSAHIPVISLHSLTQETYRILHTDRDRLDAIHFDDYYATYRLIAYYLAYLDLK